MNDEKKETDDSRRFSIFETKNNMQCTAAFSKFLSEFSANSGFFLFVIRLVGEADRNRVTAAKALLSVARNDEERAQYQKTIDEPQVVLEALKKHASVMSQNMTNGFVSAFQKYFSSIIQSAALKRPIMMSSSQTVRVDDVLKFSRHSDLVSFIIDKKINELSYGGLSEMEKYFSERIGVQMFEDDRQRDLMRLFVEIRNINVHNGGIVNDLFASRVGKVEGFPYKVGKVFHVDFDALSTLSENAMRVAIEIDANVSAKFKLRRQLHKTWRGKGKAKTSKKPTKH